MKRSIFGAAWMFLLAPVVTVAACSSARDYPIGSDCEHGFCDQGPSFAPSEDGGDASTPDSASVLMCPVTMCSFPRTTCPSSNSPCDVDLMTDDENCGSCGVRCTNGDPNQFTSGNWHCVAGQCSFACNGAGVTRVNCDGDPTNGCEVEIGSDPDNCGDCGHKCPDGFDCRNGECYNGCLAFNKPDMCDGICTNLDLDDQNCGTCGNVCDPTGPGEPPLHAGMYYGCAGGKCGRKKCGIADTADCNNDVSDGCETSLLSAENCGDCFNACPAGKECRRIVGSITRACLCEDDAETLCPHGCKRLDEDPMNCGGCDQGCPGLNRAHYSATCIRGVCGGHCGEGYAECDGLADNGCETHTSVDNRNCGACGHACLPGQVCSEGNCLVAPCDAGAGNPTK